MLDGLPPHILSPQPNLARIKMSNCGQKDWAIFRRTPKADVFLGRVKAPDEEMSIAMAIEKAGCDNRYHQRTLVARKVEGMELDEDPEYCE
jgi:hypothetical protein